MPTALRASRSFPLPPEESDRRGPTITPVEIPLEQGVHGLLKAS